MRRERDTFGSNAKKHTKAISPASGLQKVLLKEQGGQATLAVWFSQDCCRTAPEDGWLEKKS